eukprot:GSChrysophyteH2.ASY1.ANO1.865.1 assembled CDS
MKSKSLSSSSNNSGRSSSSKSSGFFDSALIPPIMTWKKVARSGKGLFNHGNTCYLNATLQCLFHTPPLVQGLLDPSTSKLALMGLGQCVIAEVWSDRGGKAVSPRGIVSNIRRISKSFRHTRQEDAHECLTELLSCVQDELLAIHKTKLSDKKAETTFISRCFGGTLASELQCPNSQCRYISRTTSYTHDLSLDLTARSVKQCLAQFCHTETLKKGNEWQCSECKKKVLATKRFKVLNAPNVLVLHLKRFTYGLDKISRHIEFDLKLEINDSVGRNKYSLYAVLVHHGGSAHSGHYTSYAMASNGQWYHYDDSSVSMVSVQAVLSQKAYVLFYSRVVEKLAPVLAPVPAAKLSIPLSAPAPAPAPESTSTS